MRGSPTHADGIACVIGRRSRTFEATPRVRSLTPELVEGLEFDLVVLVDPESFGTGIEGARRPLRRDDQRDPAARHPHDGLTSDSASGRDRADTRRLVETARPRGHHDRVAEYERRRVQWQLNVSAARPPLRVPRVLRVPRTSRGDAPVAGIPSSLYGPDLRRAREAVRRWGTRAPCWRWNGRSRARTSGARRSGMSAGRPAPRVCHPRETWVERRRRARAPGRRVRRTS